jgi:ribosomal protein S18 acetylase RimI-like enzyme
MHALRVACRRDRDAAVRELRQLRAGCEDCLVVDIAIVPELRRSGIGTAVVREIVAQSDRNGVPTRGHVELTNSASLAFWMRLGFREGASDALFVEIVRPAGG